MSILYAVVSRGLTTLARFWTCSGNFQEVAQQVLSQIPDEDGMLTFTHGSFLYHYISADGIIYLCITGDVSTYLNA